MCEDAKVSLDDNIFPAEPISEGALFSAVGVLNSRRKEKNPRLTLLIVGEQLKSKKKSSGEIGGDVVTARREGRIRPRVVGPGVGPAPGPSEEERDTRSTSRERERTPRRRRAKEKERAKDRQTKRRTKQLFG